MDKELFERMARLVCLYFEDTCHGCPFYEFRKSVDEPSCTAAWRSHRKDTELILATWIGGTDYVKTMGEQETQKEPETRREILQAAERCVCGDRDRDYGGPENSFEAIGALWGAYLWHRHELGKPGNAVGKNFIDPKDVAAMMVLFKMARVATGQNKADNWVDAAGYAACGGEVSAKKEE